ncbi:MFS transporter [Nocardia africana]
MFAAHDFLADALAKGQLSHEDFGLKRIVDEVDERPDGTPEVEYWYDGRAALTPAGRAKVEALPGGRRWLRQMGLSRLEMAASAEFTCRNKTHYVLNQGKIVIIDQGEHGLQRNPMTSSESRWSAEPGKASLAQAVEAKEIRAAESKGVSAEKHGIVVRADADSAKSITAAEIYGTDRFFDHITGASGTLTDLGEVLETVYGLKAPHAVDPFNRSRLVEGQPDVHENTRAKLNALAGYAHEMWDGGQGRFQEILCHRNDLVEKQVRALLRAGVPREAIEAVDADRIANWGADWETELQKVFDGAGEQGKILVINRQGQRGVDIAVSEAVLAKGGMHVWMTEVPEQEYIYDQAKNRTARNGKPGTAQALLSPQDALIRDAMHLRGVREAVVQYEEAVADHRTDPTPATHDKLVEAGDKLGSLVPGLQQRAHHHATADFILHYAPITDPSALITAMTPWDPSHLVGPDQLVDRSTRLAGLLGIPASSATAFASALDQNDALDRNDADPLVRLLDRANLPPSAVEALRQHLDATAPGKAVRYALLTDEQALDELTPRRDRLARAIGWDPAQIEGAEGLRHVGAAMTTARLELANALGPDVAASDVTAAKARDVLGEAVARHLSDDGTHRPAPGTDPDPADRPAADNPVADDFEVRASFAGNPVAENIVEAASLYLATAALLDLVAAIHRRNPNSCVNNGVTAMRVLCENNANHFTMPPGGIPLRGHNWDTVTSSFRQGSPKVSDSLDQAVESLQRRPGGVQVLVYKWKSTENQGSDEADNHLVLLVNDSEPGDPPNLVVVDLAASRNGRTDDDYGLEDLGDRRALLNKAVRFDTWQREQRKFIDKVPEAERAFWTIDFDRYGDLVPDSAEHDTLPIETHVPPELVREIDEAGESVRVDEPNASRMAEPVRTGSRPPVPDRAPDQQEQDTRPRGPGGLIGSRPASDPDGRAERRAAEAAMPAPAGPMDAGELDGALGRLAEHGVKVGKDAAAMAFGALPPGGQDVEEWSVPESLYEQLEREGWDPVPVDEQGQGRQRPGDGRPDSSPRHPRGRPMLARGRFRVSVGLGGVVSHEALLRRSWEADGVRTAGLPDVYAWAQERGLERDVALTDWIKRSLLSPTCPPLPEEVIKREIDEVIEILQSRLPQGRLEQLDPEVRQEVQRGVRLAAEGLFASRTLYGHPDIGRANHLYDDSDDPFEKRDYGVAAFYHNGMNVAEDLRRIVENGLLQGADIRDIMSAMVADAWSDLVYGGGRRSDKPEGYDELRSAQLLHRRALSHGYDSSTARIMAFAVNGTGFDETTGIQMVALPAFVEQMRERWELSADGEFTKAMRVARWVAAADLQTLSEPDALVDSIELALEDLMSRRFSPTRAFGQVLSEWGFRVNYVEDALRLADRFGRIPPEDGHITVRQAFINRLRGNAGFIHPDSGYRPPDGWLLGSRDMRRDHAAKMREIVYRLTNDPSYTPLDAYRDARSHAAEMGTKYSGFRWQLVVRPGEQNLDTDALADTLATRLPESSHPGTARDAISAVSRLAELVRPFAGDDLAIVVTSSEDVGQLRLHAQLDYTRPDSTSADPGVTTEDPRIDVETADPLPKGQVWHRLRLRTRPDRPDGHIGSRPTDSSDVDGRVAVRKADAAAAPVGDSIVRVIAADSHGDPVVIERLTQALAPVRREVMRSWLAGVSVAEIAERSGKQTTAVERILEDAAAQLRKWMEVARAGTGSKETVLRAVHALEPHLVDLVIIGELSLAAAAEGKLSLEAAAELTSHLEKGRHQSPSRLIAQSRYTAAVRITELWSRWLTAPPTEVDTLVSAARRRWWEQFDNIASQVATVDGRTRPGTMRALRERSNALLAGRAVKAKAIAENVERLARLQQRVRVAVEMLPPPEWTTDQVSSPDVAPSDAVGATVDGDGVELLSNRDALQLDAMWAAARDRLEGKLTGLGVLLSRQLLDIELGVADVPADALDAMSVADAEGRRLVADYRRLSARVREQDELGARTLLARLTSATHTHRPAGTTPWDGLCWALALQAINRFHWARTGRRVVRTPHTLIDADRIEPAGSSWLAGARKEYLGGDYDAEFGCGVEYAYAAIARRLRSRPGASMIVHLDYRTDPARPEQAHEFLVFHIGGRLKRYDPWSDTISDFDPSAVDHGVAEVFVTTFPDGTALHDIETEPTTRTTKLRHRNIRPTPAGAAPEDQQHPRDDETGEPSQDGSTASLGRPATSAPSAARADVSNSAAGQRDAGTAALESAETTTQESAETRVGDVTPALRVPSPFNPLPDDGSDANQTGVSPSHTNIPEVGAVQRFAADITGDEPDNGEPVLEEMTSDGRRVFHVPLGAHRMVRVELHAHRKTTVTMRLRETDKGRGFGLELEFSELLRALTRSSVGVLGSDTIDLLVFRIRLVQRAAHGGLLTDVPLSLETKPGRFGPEVRALIEDSGLRAGFESSYGDTPYPTVRVEFPMPGGTDVGMSSFLGRIMEGSVSGWAGAERPDEAAIAWLTEVARNSRSDFDWPVSRSMQLTVTASGPRRARVIQLTATDMVTGQSHDFIAREKFALAAAVAEESAHAYATGAVGPGDPRARTQTFTDRAALEAELRQLPSGSWMRLVEHRPEGTAEYEVHLPSSGVAVLMDPRTASTQPFSVRTTANSAIWQGISFDPAGEPLHPTAEYLRQLERHRTAVWERLGLDLPDDGSRAAWRRLIRVRRDIVDAELAAIDESLAALRSDEPATRDALAEPLLTDRADAHALMQGLAELDSVVRRYDRALTRVVASVGESLFDGELNRRKGRKVTPQVARFTPRSGEPQEVWVVAPEGGHIRALEAAVAIDPSMATALWSGWRIRYIQPTIGPSGVEHTTLDTDEVERGYRAAFRRELEKRLMAAYLRARREGRTVVSVRRWLKPLDEALSSIPENGNAADSSEPVQVAIALMRDGVPGWEDATPAPRRGQRGEQIVPIRAGWLRTVVVPVRLRERSTGWEVSNPGANGEMADLMAREFELLAPSTRTQRITFRSIEHLTRVIEKTLAGNRPLPPRMMPTESTMSAAEVTVDAPDLPPAALATRIRDLPTIDEFREYEVEQSEAILRTVFTPWEVRNLRRLVTDPSAPIDNPPTPSTLRSWYERLAGSRSAFHAAGLDAQYKHIASVLEQLLRTPTIGSRPGDDAPAEPGPSRAESDRVQAAELSAVLAEAGITGAAAWPVRRRFAQLHPRAKAAFVAEVRRDCHARAMDSLSAYSLDPHRLLRHDRVGPVEWTTAQADLGGHLAAVTGDLGEVKELLDRGEADSAYVVIDPTTKETSAPRDDGLYAHAITLTAVGEVIVVRDPRTTDDNGHAYPMEWEKWKTAAAERGLYPEPAQHTIYALFFDSAFAPIAPTEDDGTRPQHPIAGTANNEEPQGGTKQPGADDETSEPSQSGQPPQEAPNTERQNNTTEDPPDSEALPEAGSTEAPDNSKGLEKSGSLLHLAHTDAYVGIRLGAETLNDTGAEALQSMLSLYFMHVLGPGPAGALGWLFQMPHTVGGLVAGHMTDHTPPKKLLIGSQIVSAAGGLTATATLASGSSYSVPILVGTTLVGAGASVVYNSAIDKTLIEMVGKAQSGLSRFNNLKMNLSRVLGQGLGPIVLKAGTWTAPLIDVSTSIVNLATLRRLPASSAAPKTDESQGIRRSIAEGLRAVQNLPLIRRSYANLGVTNVYLGMQGLQFTWLITHSSLPAWEQGPVLLITPLGGVIGSLIPKGWLEKTSIDTLLTARLAGVAGSAIIEALTTNPWLASAGFASTWAVQAVVGVPVTAYVNSTTPGRVRGRVRSIGSTTARGMSAAGSLFGGTAIALLGHQTTGTSIAVTFGTIAGWSLYRRLFKARRLLDCIDQTSQATWALGLDTGTRPKKRQKSPEHLRRAIATQLVKIEFDPDTENPITKTIEDVRNLEERADTAVLLLDDGKRMHSLTITNADNKPGGNVVIFDTNITDPDDPHTDPNDPERIPRVRTLDKWEESYSDIEEAFVAYLTSDEDDNLTNLYPYDPSLEAPREDGKIRGPLEIPPQRTEAIRRPSSQAGAAHATFSTPWTAPVTDTETQRPASSIEVAPAAYRTPWTAPPNTSPGRGALVAAGTATGASRDDQKSAGAGAGAGQRGDDEAE